MATDVVPAGGIVLSGLSKSYGSIRAVRSLDLAIAPGETVALLGPNGAGKSTTIDMILGLTRPDHGTAQVFGVPPARAVRAGRVGGMLQSGQPLDHLRVRELIALTASYYPAPLKVQDVLRLTGADAPVSGLPGSPVARLSASGSMRPTPMRPDHPDRQRAGRSRRPGDGDQGTGRLADDQGNAAGCGHRSAARAARSAGG